MGWWGNSLNSKTFQPKQKSRFVVEMNNGGKLASVKSVSKPAATIESKQYKMINHYYNYPGLVKWEPITITFVDTKMWGFSSAYNKSELTKNERIASEEDDDFEETGYGGSLRLDEKKFGPPNDRMTSHALWEMLVASGYTPPSYGKSDIITNRYKDISTPEKASTMENSFGGTLKIHQLHPDGASEKGVITSVETWELHNPTITKISWGDLDYGDDNLVEYKIDIVYDWAIHHPENPNSKQIKDKVNVGTTTTEL